MLICPGLPAAEPPATISTGQRNPAASTNPVVTGITGTTYTDTNLNSGTTYYYQVVAVNGSGPAGYSPEAHATTTGVNQDPRNSILKPTRRVGRTAAALFRSGDFNHAALCGQAVAGREHQAPTRRDHRQCGLAT
jgi:hypothetical protein